MLALSAWLIVRATELIMNDNAAVSGKTWPGLVLRLSRDMRSTVSVQLTQQPIGLIESAHCIGGSTRIRMFFKRPLLVSLPNGAERTEVPAWVDKPNSLRAPCTVMVDSRVSKEVTCLRGGNGSQSGGSGSASAPPMKTWQRGPQERQPRPSPDPAMDRLTPSWHRVSQRLHWQPTR